MLESHSTAARQFLNGVLLMLAGYLCATAILDAATKREALS
jgi:hypothetical protein